jgi:DNA polymerase III subunit beta
MHINVETVALRNILEVAARVSTKHITLPILQCVLLQVSGSKLLVKATNLEIGIEGTLTVDSKTDGVLAVPAPILLQTVNLITQKTVTLTSKNDVLCIESQTSRTEIKTIPADDFPHIPKISGEEIKIKGELFSLGIKTTAFAASQSSIKPELGSIYIFQKREHSLTFVATDSFRLVEKTIPQKGISLSTHVLIPFKNALELARATESVSDEVTLILGESQCALSIGSLYVTSRLISGTFPDYEQIIPKEYQVTTTILTKDLANALRKTNIFLNKFMQLTLVINKNTLTLSSQSGESGTTTESITATTDGGEITLNFNQRYISDVLGYISDESIILKCAGIGRPMVIENVHDRSIRYLVMPMNK